MSNTQSFFRETFDPQGRLQRVEAVYPENFNFAYDVADVYARKTPGKRAMVWCDGAGEARTFSFADVKEQSDRMANVFRSGGIGPGDRVMLLLKRHYEYWFAALALHKLGAVMIPATHMLTVKDLVYRLQAAQVKGVVCTDQDQVPEKLRQALAQGGLDCKRWCVRPGQAGFVDLTAQTVAASPRWARVPTRATDPMVLYFTSGTTGQPKGVIHDHTYPLAHYVTARYWQGAEDDGLHFTVAETGWAKASWGKLYGQWLVGSAVMIYDFDNFDPAQLTQIIDRFGVTSFCAPPTVYRYLVRKGLSPMPSLRHASTAGEMLAPEVFRRFTQRTGLPLCEGYGQTETTLLLANFHQPVAGSMGTPSPFYRLALWGKDGQPVAPGEVGEIVVLPPDTGRQPGIFTGYLDNEAQYRHAWRGGVYHTGDAARQDETGHFWFQGRFDDIIKTGGFRVGPDEVEHVLLEHPAVAECSVIGVPDPLRGQAIKAVVVPAPGIAPTAALGQEIKAFCNGKMAEYKWIRLVEFVEAMPKTISGKIQKAVLRNGG